ncbi:zinc finger BED domain-containing protein DAYSLEEPER-like [Miscanthus floridulus]|uniref:zinc finger BED domain-containing protein DAYSLEEPER-like n=1 Tax=Miscanthus floridulus TaxID=154761 RepID=UPI0034593BB5
MTNFLKSFHEDTCTLSGTKYLTANLYFKGVFKIHSQLLQVAKEPQNFMSPMVKEMKIKFDKFWSDYSLILLCAAVLDPRYKLNLLRYCYKKIHVDEFAAEEQVNKVVTKLYELFDEYKVLNPSPSITNPKPTKDPKIDLDILEFWKASSMSYPELASMARDLLNIPFSSVASESAFSIGKKATEATELDDTDEVMAVD